MFKVSKILKSKKNRASMLVMALLGCLTIGSVSAYFTDADTVTNEFTVGKVTIDLVEPDWGGKTEDVTPLQEITKNPKIENDGINDAFVFMTVTVPYKNVVTANADGSRNEAANTQLFNYTVNSGWELLQTADDKTAQTYTHLYAYAAPSQTMTALKATEITPALFEKVIVANFIEDQGLELTNQDIVVNAYAIQTNNINGGQTKATAVWNVIAKQNPDTAVDVIEDAITDAKKD